MKPYRISVIDTQYNNYNDAYIYLSQVVSKTCSVLNFKFDGQEEVMSEICSMQRCLFFANN